MTKQELKKLLKQADYVVYTKLNHVSQSGMTRAIEPIVIVDNKPYYIGGTIADLFGYKHHKKGGIKMVGYGMDMGFALVYGLSCRLYCPTKYDHDKAYKLTHRWL